MRSITDYVIAIPTYRRAQMCQELTLAYLEKCDIPEEQIFLFLSDDQDHKEYSEELKDRNYQIVFNQKLESLKDKHNYIVDHFPEGKQIVLIEDDISYLVKKKGSRTEPFFELRNLIKLGFENCIRTGAKMWGISPTDNGFYMSSKLGKNTTFIAGYFFGFINDKRIKVGTSHKHDYERTILNNILFGGSFRFNMIGQKSASFTNKGGIQSEGSKEERAAREMAANDYLISRYPKHVARRSRYNNVLKAETELRLLK